MRLECQCGFSSGSETTFRKHLERFSGKAGHDLRTEAQVPSAADEGGKQDGSVPEAESGAASPTLGSTLASTLDSGESEVMRHRGRAMSMLSKTAITDLSRSSAELAYIETSVEEIAAQLSSNAVNISQAKSNLGRLETQAKCLETTGVDSVYTSELQTGKVAAKSEKKEQLARLEILFDRFEEIFKQIRDEEAAAKSASQSHNATPSSNH